MCFAHAGVTDPAVLVTPVGVVHIVSHQVINLLGRSHLCTALTGRAKECKAKLVSSVEHLVGSKIVGKRAVVYTVNPVITA